ncbi:MAG: chalcone isomerase family protein [Granulosicoccus sp.]|nr:chalcone isomerase family protein [Granulosicoccus sp.]
MVAIISLKFPFSSAFLTSLALFSIALSTPSLASSKMPVPVETFLESPELVGQTTFKVMLARIFDAALYAPRGEFNQSRPFALSLTYRRNFRGHKIVKKTIDEIRSQSGASDEQLQAWKFQLSSIIPNVGASDTITGVRTADAETLFFLDDQEIGRIADPAFTKSFFNIWLGEKTSQRKLRRQLIGTAQS